MSHTPSAAGVAATSYPSEIFKAYDIRGIVDKTLTPSIVEGIGQAIGSEALKRGCRQIAVGRDGRLSGPDIVAALARGITRAGADVIDIGRVPTPVLYFATSHLGTNAGVAVTGSHNPPEYNGLKMVLGSETLSGEAIQDLRRRLTDNDLAQGQGRIVKKDVREDYLARITGDVKPARKLKVVVDCGNGVAGELAPELLRRLGCDVTELFCEIDGTFPNHHPDPSQPKNLKDIIAKVKAGGYDIGLAFDGDGDRLGVIAPDGEVIWPDRQMILYARDVLSRHAGGKIIFDVKSSRLLEREIAAAGGEPCIWKTGHSFIKAKLKESGALLAGEMSGHIFFKERWYGFDDALYTAARLVELLARDKRSTTEIFKSLPNSVNTPELHIQLAEGENHTLVPKLVAEANMPNARLTTIDGLRADFSDGFGLVRASNTTPVVVLRFEADNAQALSRIQGYFHDLILRVRPGTDLPF